ncbi:MAG: fibronectin type III domain-containing protein, partial [Ignavibacteriales bacterium]|nr:fibronectin type III domain-containing protein [Ignavibacteriales bacterium]
MKLLSTILHQGVPALGGSAKACGASGRCYRYSVLASMLLVVLLAGTIDLYAQTPSLANYTITRQTGITYNSISSTGNSIPAWRNSYQWIFDDNRSYPISIGFDFWYDGIRYTTLSVSTNGFVDFSSSAADGSIGANQTGRDYDSENFTVSSTVPYPGSRASWNVLAPLYYDLTTQNETNPLGTSFKYLTSGVAPNRIFTVEFDSLSAWNQAGLGTALNFQVKLYETTGKIEFVYGNMIPGSASYAYSCAINGPDLSGGLTAANFRTQQTVNTATFGTTPVNNLTPAPASLSQLRFLPPTPLDPTSLTFTSVTTTSMQLNWTDNATNEVGYAIYMSSDGSNYSFITQLSAFPATGPASYAATGLTPNTTYYWRVYAISEGGVSNVLAGSRTTAGAPTNISVKSGLWSDPTTWQNGVPTLVTDVTIADGHTVTIDCNFTVNSLTLGTGASGILRYGNDNTPRYDTVATNISINSGAILDVNTSSNTNGHLMVLGGDLTNNGTLNFATDADSKVRLEFKKSGTQVINGSGVLTKVYRMTLNMGSSSNNILDVFTPSFTADTANFVVINNGTLRFSTSATMTPLAGNAQIPATGGLWLNNSSANITVTDSLAVAGLLRITNGTLSVGSTVNGHLRSAGGTFVFEGGSTTVAGLFDAKNITTITNFSMTAGTLTVNTAGSTYAYAAPFSMPIAGSSFTMTGGTIIIQRMSGNNLGYTNTGASSSYAVSGGTIQIGNGSTPGTDILRIQSTVPIYNLTISGLAGATGLAGTNLTVLNNVTV